MFQEISKSCTDACQAHLQSGGLTKLAAKEMEIGIAFIAFSGEDERVREERTLIVLLLRGLGGSDGSGLFQIAEFGPGQPFCMTGRRNR